MKKIFIVLSTLLVLGVLVYCYSFYKTDVQKEVIVEDDFGQQVEEIHTEYAHYDAIENNVTVFLSEWIEDESWELYASSPYITATFAAKLSRILESETLHSDPVLCAQDIPSEFHVESIVGNDTEAIATVYTSWWKSWGVLEFQMVNTDGVWLINDEKCGGSIEK